MAFDQTTRNRLARFVGDARALLTEECTRQLQLEYGMDPASGEVTDLDKLSRLNDAERETARLLRETLAHYETSVTGRGAKVRQEAIERIVREQAFTVLNRLCALRMAEARGLLIESVAAGYQSKGFQLYARLAGPALGETGDAYRCYLFSLFDEFAVDLAVLFDRFSPQGRLFPREAALLELLGLINHPEIDALWAEDETIGWIYQYFNSKEERKAMRDASAAPRNSRELAVRNQFFTPRYVVEFLADNTLGRIWYEMTRGETSLKESCRYLVRRPSEVFLAEGESAPGDKETGRQGDQEISQEELLRQPVHIQHRPLKDPRAITLLDPACGSMHFGLYAFDLFERMYDEAWELESERGAGALERAPMDAPLHEAYPDKEAFLRDVPRLIVERNIHGVDIDPRAVQIAGLSLWLRAQRSWREQGLKPQERPQIRRSNVVCAEPMPGDNDLLEEFIARHLSGNSEDKVVAWMLRKVFNAMALAGEAGSLLKIEDEISAIAAEAKKQWRQGPNLTQSSFSADEAERITQRALGLDASGVTDASFWTRVEERIDAALKDYAAYAEGEGTYRRRLFAGDAARGFAFIDLCRKRYDVVLMNPPFGVASAAWKATFEKVYPHSKNDLYAAFVERGIEVQHHNGMLGAITSRTGFFLTSFQKWREEILLREAPPTVFADLGYGVLDSAKVETAAYCLGTNLRNSSLFLRIMSFDNKDDMVADFANSAKQGRLSLSAYVAPPRSFGYIPGSPFVYWASIRLRKKFSDLPRFESNAGEAKVGLATGDDFRFVRAFWEISPIIIGRRWFPFAKGGSFSPFYSKLHLMIDWLAQGLPIELSFIGARVRKPYYFRSGITWGARPHKRGAFSIVPRNVLFSHTGMMVFPPTEKIWEICALLNSDAYIGMLHWLMPRGSSAQTLKYEAGFVLSVPVPELNGPDAEALRIKAIKLFNISRSLDTFKETSVSFLIPALTSHIDHAIRSSMKKVADFINSARQEIDTLNQEINNISFRLYGIQGPDRHFVEISSRGTGHDEQVVVNSEAEEDQTESEEMSEQEDFIAESGLINELISYIVGTSVPL
jgi:hypothetical protein